MHSEIVRFDPIEDIWTKLGDLKVPREGHGVILVDNEFVVVGGVRGNTHAHEKVLLDEPTESCKLTGDSMTCTMREPKLKKCKVYPELMLIP